MMGWRPRYDCHCKISVLGRWRYDRYCVMDVMVKISVLERRWSANLAATPSNVLEVGISLEISGFLFKQVLFFHLGNLIFMSLTFNFKVTNQIVRNEKTTRIQDSRKLCEIKLLLVCKSDQFTRFDWFDQVSSNDLRKTIFSNRIVGSFKQKAFQSASKRRRNVFVPFNVFWNVPWIFFKTGGG